MTQRERQILRWIEENPLISQQELADKAGIARSSVAVHMTLRLYQPPSALAFSAIESAR